MSLPSSSQPFCVIRLQHDLQIERRAARALVEMNQKELAQAARVGSATIKRFEVDKQSPIRNNMAAIRKALEDAGVMFLDRTKTRGPGVCLKA